MADLKLLMILVAIGSSWLAIATMPRWLFTSLNRSCLWQLRDRVAIDLRDGKLPRSEVVRDLLTEVETAISIVSFLSPVTRWRLERVLNRLAGDEGQREAPHDRESKIDSWLFEQQMLYYQNADRLKYLINRQIFTGSWAGLAMVGGLLLSGLVGRVRLRRHSFGDVLPTFVATPDTAVVTLWGVAMEIPRDSGAAQRMSHTSELVDVLASSDN